MIEKAASTRITESRLDNSNPSTGEGNLNIGKRYHVSHFNSSRNPTANNMDIKISRFANQRRAWCAFTAVPPNPRIFESPYFRTKAQQKK